MAWTPGLLDIYSASCKAQNPSTIGAEDQIPTWMYRVLLHPSLPRSHQKRPSMYGFGWLWIIRMSVPHADPLGGELAQSICMDSSVRITQWSITACPVKQTVVSG